MRRCSHFTKKRNQHYNGYRRSIHIVIESLKYNIIPFCASVKSYYLKRVLLLRIELYMENILVILVAITELLVSVMVRKIELSLEVKCVNRNVINQNVFRDVRWE